MRTLFLTCLAVSWAAPFVTSAPAQPRERTLFVMVLDKEGKPVPDMGLSDFTVREDGTAREVLRVSRAVVPIDVAVVVDNSWAAEKDIPFIRSGLEAFVDVMTPHPTRAAERGGASARPGGAPARDELGGVQGSPPLNHVALITFGDRPEVRSDYTTSPAQLKAGIARLFAAPESGAYLQEALIDVSRGLQKRDAERVAIVVVHTEGPEFSNSHYDSVIEAVKKSGARLVVLTLTSPRGDLQTTEARSRAIVIDRGTRVTGGYRDILISNQALPDKLKLVANQLLNEYQVVYGRPDTLIPPEKIEVSVKKPDLVARGTLARTPVNQPPPRLRRSAEALRAKAEPR